MKDYEKQQRKELERESKKKAKASSGIHRKRNREYTIVAGFFVLIFLSLIGYLIYYNTKISDSFINSPYNTRQDTFSDRVVRGRILSSDGQILAQTNVDMDGNEERFYPYSNMFAHVIGFDSNGKSGLESEANFQLLTSHQFFMDQMINEFRNQKNLGDTVVTSLSVGLQTAAYNALGDRRGAIIAIEPATGRILLEVSKPDFDPNYLRYNWDNIIHDENNSSLLNRATNGAYPPGSTFKIVTALDYYRRKGTLEGFQYLCEGTVTRDDYTIRCYNSTVHGQEDLAKAFASSCNCAFAELGIELGASSIRNTAEDLLFNKRLPLDSYKQSIFSLISADAAPLVMQTAIGQGNTLVSPAHMAMISCAVANDGILMKPTLIDRIETWNGEVISTAKKSEYQRLMTSQEAAVLSDLMKGAVLSGTAYALYGRGYEAAGKTGSAEFDEYGSSHSWFTGYAAREDGTCIAIAVIVEGGGTGSETAVPIAAQIFDTWYYS